MLSRSAFLLIILVLTVPSNGEAGNAEWESEGNSNTLKYHDELHRYLKKNSHATADPPPDSTMKAPTSALAVPNKVPNECNENGKKPAICDEWLAVSATESPSSNPTVEHMISMTPSSAPNAALYTISSVPSQIAAILFLPTASSISPHSKDPVSDLDTTLSENTQDVTQHAETESTIGSVTNSSNHTSQEIVGENNF